MMAVLVLALSGCVTIPTTGTVQQVNPPPAGNGAPQVDVEPASPVPDGNPDSILAGFLAAVASASPNRFAIARQYLTPQAAEEWDPAQGVTIYNSDGTPTIVTDKNAVLKAPVLGRLDSDGHYTSVIEPDYSHSFAMAQDADGQWRISDPGVGIFISQYRFQQTYRAMPVYFFNRTLDRLVVENLYLNWADDNATSAVEGLLQGPSAWLSPAALTMIPPQTKLAVSAVAVQDGVALVSLTQQANGLTDTQQLQMAAQLFWTLRAVPTSITGVRIDVEGQPMTVRGQDEEGVIRANTVAAFRTAVQPSSQIAYGLTADGAVVQLPASPGKDPQPVAGPLGTIRAGLDDTPDSLAVSPDGATLALATPSGLWTAPTTGGGPATKVLDVKGLRRPQVDDTGVWAVSNDKAAHPTLWLVDASGQTQHVALKDLDGGTVTSFRVAPDRTRVAVTVNMGGKDILGLLRIGSVQPLSVDGWRSLAVNTGRGELAACADVGWVSPTQLVVLSSSTKDANVVAYRMDVDAALVDSLGPVGGDTPVALTAQPRADGTAALVVTGGGTVLQYEDRTRWSTMVTGLKAVALPG